MQKFTLTFFNYLLRVLLIFMGLNGSAGGIFLMLKPDGSLLGMEQYEI
jgi:hypothetical protein